MAMTGRITIDKGRAQQNNFYEYTVLKLADAPRIEVHVVPSTENPTGIGELGTAPIAPAIANAIFKGSRQEDHAHAFQRSPGLSGRGLVR